MKLLVYTCVFGKYDLVFPPIMPEPELDYLIITDDASMQVRGWQTHVVDAAHFLSPKAANLHFRALVHREFSKYDASLYIDGNIRLIGKMSAFFTKFLESGATLGLFPHPLRDTVADEIAACLTAGKVVDPNKVNGELEHYRKNGFLDDVGLIETTIILKNHRGNDLDAAMDMWWSMFEKFGSRDQFSLPYVISQVEVSCFLHDWNFRESNPLFGMYPHVGNSQARPLHIYVAARAYDNAFYASILGLWHLSWKLRRFLRQNRIEK